MPALETMTFPYKGQDITIHVRGDIAHVHVDKKVIPCMLHPGNLPMWMCNEAYFGTPDITELARHMADYHYMFNDPNRAPIPSTVRRSPSRPNRRIPGRTPSCPRSGRS